MTTAYTNIPKPTGASYTKVSKPGDRYGYAVYGVGRYGTGNDNTFYTKIAKPTGSPYTKIAKPTS